MTVKTITSAILSKMSGISKSQSKFMVNLFVLILSLRGRLNYLNLSRYGDYNEKSYRKQFNKDFDFEVFNKLLVTTFCSNNKGIIFDPSHISKSGKHTPGVGYFWSGCANSTKWGLEIGGLAIVDFDNHTAFHYIAEQTILKDKKEESLLGYYSTIIKKRAEELLALSSTIYVDAFFSKQSFVQPIVEQGFHLVSRLQSNAYLRYRYIGEQSKKQGRPKIFDGKINPKNITHSTFSIVRQNENERIYEGLAHSRALNRWIKVAIVQGIKEGQVSSAHIYFSTDTSATAIDIYTNYRLRFQIEYLYRDSKQHLGLTQCQSRNTKALHFHFNASLTTLNLAKIAHWLTIPKETRGAFSIADIKTQYINENLLNQLILIYGKDPIVEINTPAIRALYDLGRIAA
jgi:hypothetical protein